MTNQEVMKQLKALFAQASKPTSLSDFRLVPQAVMKDGFKISIQASSTHYCKPRATIDVNEYISMELGYPSNYDELIKDYAEDTETFSTVYTYTPIEIIIELIKKHGGIKGFTCPEDNELIVL